MNKQLSKSKGGSSAAFQPMSATIDYSSKTFSAPHRAPKMADTQDEVISEEELLQFWWKYYGDY